MKSETKVCQNCKCEFTIEPDDFQFYEKIKVPPPTWCPECRLQRRLAFRNERSLYKRKCDLCRDDIIAVYSPDKPFTVYCPTCYYSDKWDSLAYGRDYDFSRPFFAQWRDLQLKVPRLSLFQQNVVNSPWVNYELDDKNCYLNVGGHKNEDSAYNQYVLRGKDCFDNYWTMDSQFAYESILSEKCYKIFYSTFCFDCRDTYFSFDCRDCSNIFGCTGLRHRQYHIFNEPVSKEKFQAFISENTSGSRAKLTAISEQAYKFWRSKPQRAVFIDQKSVNSRGNFLKESKNCRECVMAEKTEDSRYIFLTLQVKDSYDATSVWGAEQLYEVWGGSEQLSRIHFSMGVPRQGSDIEYSEFLLNCHNCFGCISLRNKNHVILNKQYTKNEYEILMVKILKHMAATPYLDKRERVYKYGEFFPPELSPYGYNETVANEYFPLDKKQVFEKGLNWNEYESETAYAFSDYAIPDDVKDVNDGILEKVLKSEASGKPYRIIPMELTFYRRFNLPIPRLTPFERHQKRLLFIAKHRKVQNRECGNCGRSIPSVYTKEEFPVVYCESCYNSEVV
ncbi:MAG: hypothetical protein HY435_01880 [Candidatus Liptonbacteria bacterium]|nr:hypothetical protein [Candidatus Liptonbacteria bacterium]